MILHFLKKKIIKIQWLSDEIKSTEITQNLKTWSGTGMSWFEISFAI